MKLFLASFAAAPLLLCGLATPATAAPVDGPAVVVDIAVQLDNKVDELEEAFKAKKPTEPIFQDMLTLADQWTDVQTFRIERLKRAILDLQERARRAALVYNDFWRLRCQVIECRLCFEIRCLWKQAKNRDATREDFQRVADLMATRAELAMVPQDLRERLQNAIDLLMGKYLETSQLDLALVVVFEDDFVISRVDRAIAWLEDMALKRQATREQFLYVKDLMTDRGRIWNEDLEFQAFVRKAHYEIDQLMNRLLQGEDVTREEFKKLHDMCCERAREAIG